MLRKIEVPLEGLDQKAEAHVIEINLALERLYVAPGPIRSNLLHLFCGNNKDNAPAIGFSARVCPSGWYPVERETLPVNARCLTRDHAHAHDYQEIEVSSGDRGVSMKI